MKYADQYPNAEPLEMVSMSIMRGRKCDNCCHCGRLTNFIDIDFEAYVCSEECDEALTNEWMAAIARTSGKYTCNI